MASTERHDQRRPVPGEDAVQVSPAGPLAGTVRVPGDKSVSHRLAMLCGLAAGESTVHNFLAGQDCVLIATDHTAYDYDFIVRHAPLVIDTRNATKQVTGGREKIRKA